MGRIFAFLYGVAAYFIFFGTILYMIGFVGNLWVPKSVDTGPVGSMGSTVIIDVSLIFLFALQHTIMARLAFKEWWTKFLPKPVERSAFVLLASLFLILLFWQWRPLPTVVWRVNHPVGVYLLWGIFILGWALVFFSTFIINHFDLFGLRQVYLYLTKREYSPVPFKVVSLYKIVRNPLMLGFILAIWATPLMTQGHLLFSVTMTVYILVGIQFEERTLMKVLGREYTQYRYQTSMIIPVPKLPGKVR